MILDGYNEFAQLNLDEEPVRIVYRPALRHERIALFGMVSYLANKERAQDVFSDEITKRIVNWEDIPGDLSPVAHSVLLKAVLGQEPRTTEKEDAQNLAEGVRLQVEFPAMQHVTCDDCRKWQMDPLTGTISERPKGNPLLRMPEDVLLCKTKQGCPKGSYENPKGLSEKNKQALRHYLECRAVGHFPDDAIVKNNARIIANELKKADGRFCFCV